MTIATHAVVAAASAQILSYSPLDAFLLGVFSHFILDAIPHWDYNLDILSQGFKMKPIIKDSLRLALDFLIGFLLIFFFFQWLEPFNFILWSAALGAITPDILHNLENFWKTKTLSLFSKFHHWCHCKKDLNNAFLGIIIQLFVITVFIYLTI
jgi:hypothetical protein